MVGDQVNQTTTTTTEAPKKVAPATTTATTTTTTPVTPTTGRNNVSGPTKRSRAPANSSVVFPSVKNKPGFANSSYFYEYTEPQKIRVSRFLLGLTPAVASALGFSLYPHVGSTNDPVTRLNHPISCDWL